MQCLLGRARIAAACSSSSSSPMFFSPRRLLASTSSALQASMPSRPKPPPDSEIEESYLKGSGPGGQKINKTNSAVQLKHLPTGIVVKSQATRSRSQNRKIARDILAQRLDDLLNGEQSRAGIVGAVRKKRADSAAKKSRRKYKKLEEEKQQSRQVAEQEARQGEEGGGGAVAVATGEGEGVGTTTAHRDTMSRDAIVHDGMAQSRQKLAEKPDEYKGDSSQTNSDAIPSQPIDAPSKNQ
ncbi:peptidyl-tRNA hydrolase domain-containing protein [Cordyceps javanica]|uniref:Peptidyl-tRNA hydrolase domain-containing protein n=1 Tax=Cordyceps javanica TaxID=43265 RepID=A0A545URQ9_9HYPO|nr:peptidyl-tRNA hydrolase domain-containing protein [Cordyceps javanica]TQW04055.1 peptidyl-tRNA hydrolase domain protein [Cordyceps javanica]